MKKLNLAQQFWLLGGLFSIVLCSAMGFLFITTSSISQLSWRTAHLDIPALNHAHLIKLNVIQVQQWLTDISATRARDGLNDGFKIAAQSAEAFHKQAQQLQQLYPHHSDELEQMEQSFDAYYQTGRNMAHAYINGGPEAGNLIMSEFDRVAETLSEQVDLLLKEVTTRTQQTAEEQESELRHLHVAVAASFVLLATSMILIIVVILRAFGAFPIILKRLKMLAQGHLTSDKLNIQRDDEVGQLARSVEETSHSLKTVIKQISCASDHVVNAADELSSSTLHTRNHMQLQQNDIEHMAHSIQMMSGVVLEISQNASSAEKSAQHAKEEASNGKQVVNMTIEAINALADDVEASSQVINKLDKESNNIGGILDVIRGIADQTNLLALNAAIEAARAGEHGRGFAVVADEVRVLAQRTQESTQEIQQMIEQLQFNARNAVQAMEQGRNRAEESVKKARSAGERLHRITTAVKTISSMISQIAAAATRQGKMAQEVSHSISNIRSSSHATAEDAKQTAQSSETLRSLALQMERVVSHFQTTPSRS
ncbi:MAG: HAMP domain-containing methyl-accepting chemotaxis protein [Gammaproteobacteria bacterium]|nr:HAMP domain-containing methyl-accepting chemotaxis protein [Gammaproteobacteria bacterium]